MPLLKVPHQYETRMPRAVNEIPLSRIFAAGSLLAAVVMLANGKRKAGIALASAGTVAALMEDPETVRKWWEAVPEYTKNAQHFLERVEGFVSELSDKGDKVRKIFRRA